MSLKEYDATPEIYEQLVTKDARIAELEQQLAEARKANLGTIPSEHDIKNHMVGVIAKWGNRRNPYIMLAVIQEELGEVAQEVLKENPEKDIRRELIDLVAPVLIMIDDMDYIIEQGGGNV